MVAGVVGGIMAEFGFVGFNGGLDLDQLGAGAGLEFLFVDGRHHREDQAGKNGDDRDDHDDLDEREAGEAVMREA